MTKYNFVVTDGDDIRIDKYLSTMTDISREKLQKLIENKEIFVNGSAIKSSYKIKINDLIAFNYIEEIIEILPEDIPLDVRYEDEHILVLCKPQELIVHPSQGIYSGTLVNGLLHYTKHLGNSSDEMRPGIVHRLDKDTSGLMVIAKTDEAYHKLVNMMKSREIKKTYLGIVHGNLRGDMYIDKPIGRSLRDRKKMAINYENGREAQTGMKVLENLGEYTLVELDLETGRTHQIRVHMASVGSPIVGDLVYGNKNKFGIDKQLLHAWKLQFKHPITGEEMEFSTEVPDRFEKFLAKVRK